MKKTKLSVSIAAIVLGILIVLAFSQNASSVGPHLLPPLAEPPTVTPIPYSQNLDLAPNIPANAKSTIIIRRNDGTYAKILVAPGTMNSQLPLNEGDQIVAVLPPNSFKVKQLSPIRTPQNTSVDSTDHVPTPASQPTVQDQYSGNEP